MANTVLPSIEATKKAAGTIESPADTMIRIKAELAAKGELTGVDRQLAIERKAGIPSFRAPAPGVPEYQTTPSLQVPTIDTASRPTFTPSFTNTVIQKVTDKAKESLDQKLGASDSYDSQLIRAEAALLKIQLGENLTPEDLRWLSPSQQAAVRSGDDNLVKSERAALNFIRTEREKAKEKEEIRKEKELERIQQEQQKVLDITTNAFNIYAKNNLWKNLSGAERIAMETTLGLPKGTIGAMANSGVAEEVEYEIRSLSKDRILQIKKDKKTGKILSQEVMNSAGSKPLTPPKKDDDESILSKDAFLSAAMTEGINLGNGMGSPDISSPKIQAQIERLYQEYLNAMKAIQLSSGEVLRVKKLKERLTKTDLQKMTSTGLDPNDAEDILTYLDSKNTKKSTSAPTKGKREL